MMVTVKAMVLRNDSWFIEKRVECPEDKAMLYVKMFLDAGYEKVRVD